ncbi:MAG TPA: hypothetical protein VIM58_00465 [Candidatus Methylacidiphilales bacterium]
MLFPKKADAPLDPEIAALLRSRRAMFDSEPSLLPDFHRRLRASAMRRVSVREAFAARISGWIEEHLSIGASIRYAGAAAAVALLGLVAVNQSVVTEAAAPVLTLKSSAASTVSPTLALATPGGRVDYAMNDVQPASAVASLDQQIDRSTVGGDLNAAPSNAQYILPKAPSTYDSVVAF